MKGRDSFFLVAENKIGVGGGGGRGEANQLEREVFEIFWMKGWCFPCTPIVGNPAFPDLHPFSGS